MAKSKPFDEIFWNLVCRCFLTKKKCYKKTFLDFGLFWPFFNQKTAKIDQKWRNLAKSKPFDEIFWNLVCRCFPTKKNATNNFFLDFGLFCPFFNHKKAKIDQKWRKLAKSKPFRELFWNFVCRCFPTKENATKKLFLDFGIFWAFFGKKTAKID